MFSFIPDSGYRKPRGDKSVKDGSPIEDVGDDQFRAIGLISSVVPDGTQGSYD